jgi:hypothetical protein
MNSASEAKPRPLKLDSHILAYLGDYITVYEETIKRLARKASNSQYSQAQTQSDPKCTASAPNRS